MPRLTISEIIDDVAAAPGTAIGVEAHGMHRIWEATCDSISEAMLSHRSVIFPLFAHFVVQKQQGASGTWGMRTSYVPSVAFLPTFCDAYRVKKPVAMKQVHLGASVPVPLNASVIGSKAGQPRHAVNNVLRDIVREIGARLAEGTAMTIDMSFCQIDFRSDRTHSVRWESEFAETFATVFIPSAPSANGKGGPRTPQRPATARAAVASQRLGHPGTPQAAPAPANTEGPSSARMIPAPPPATAKQPVAEPQPSSRPSSARSSSARSIQGTPSISHSPSPRRTPDFHQSPSVQRAQDLKKAIDGLKYETALTPYQKRKNRKTLFRQLRNKAYEDSWEHQLEIKRQIAAEDRARDRAKVEAFKTFIAEQEQRERDNAVARRAEELQVQDMNRNLLSAREQLALPRVVDAGDIFNARQPTFESKPDKSFLATQIRLAEERRAREKAEDRIFGRNAQAVADTYKAERIEAVKQKRQAQAETREMYLAQIAHRKEEEDRYKRELTNGGALLFSGEDDAKAELDDKRRVLEQSRATQDVNKKTALNRSRLEREEKEQQRKDLQLSQREFADKERMLRMQKKRQDNAVRDSLRGAWDESIDKRRQAKTEEREEMRQWREHNYLRNESSDDDE